MGDGECSHCTCLPNDFVRRSSCSHNSLLCTTPLAVFKPWRRHFYAHPSIPLTIMRPSGQTSICSPSLLPARAQRDALSSPPNVCFFFVQQDVGGRIARIAKKNTISSHPPHHRVILR